MQGFLKNLLHSFCVGLLAICIFILYFQLWNYDLSMPLFNFDKDYLLNALVIKNIIETGWITSNPRIGVEGFLDYSIIDHPHYSDFFNLLMIKFIAYFTDNVFLVINLFFIFTFFLVAFTSFLVLRQFKISIFISILFAILFSFIPYRIVKNDMHLFLINIMIVPLIILVSKWIYEEKIKLIGINNKNQLCLKTNKYFYFSIFLSFLFATNGLYYAIYVMIILTLSYIISSLYKGSFINQNFAVISILLSSIFLILLIINAPSIIAFVIKDYSMPIRSHLDLFYFSLKIYHIFIPISNHYIDFFREFATHINPVKEYENEPTALGIIGSIGFIFSILWIIFSINDSKVKYVLINKLKLHENEVKIISFLVSLILLIILFAIHGGFISLIIHKFPLIRANARMIIFIAFMLFIIMAIIIDKIAIMKFLGNENLTKIIILIIAVFALFDQVGRPNIQNEKNKNEFLMTKKFVENIENSIPKNSAIFVIPFNEFPEYYGDNYKNIYLYLFSKNLKFSYPINRSSKSLKWQNKIIKDFESNLNDSINALKNKGFVGIYYDRNNYKMLTEIYKDRPNFEFFEKILFTISYSKIMYSDDLNSIFMIF